MISLASCQSHEVNDGPELVKQVADSASIRVLALGNSFTDNATGYMPQILQELGLNGDVFFAKLTLSGSSLQNHWENHLDVAKVYDFSFADAGEWVKAGMQSINHALSFTDWDVVVIQQVSYLAGKPDSFHPWLDNLAVVIRMANPSVRLGWQMTWAYCNNTVHDGFVAYGRDNNRMYHEIIKAADDAGKVVDFVIPSAKAVNSLVDVFGYDRIFLDDGYHLMPGISHFMLSVLWYNSFMSDLVNIPLCDNAYYNVSSPLHLSSDEYNAVIDIIKDLTHK